METTTTEETTMESLRAYRSKTHEFICLGKCRCKRKIGSTSWERCDFVSHDAIIVLIKDLPWGGIIQLGTMGKE